jgi:hypothetical protein
MVASLAHCLHPGASGSIAGQKKAPYHSGQWFILEEPLSQIASLGKSSLSNTKFLTKNKKSSLPWEDCRV